MSFYNICLTLFLLIDPFGNIPVFLAMLSGVPAARRKWVIIREAAIGFMILTLFLFLGQSLLRVMGLSVAAVQIAGGIILFLVAIRMIYPPPRPSGSSDQETEEPFIVPMATPLIAGPSAMAMVMLFAQNNQTHYLLSWLAIVVAVSVSAIILVSGTYLHRLLGARAMKAVERLMGMVLTILAVQMLLNGFSAYIAHSSVICAG